MTSDEKIESLNSKIYDMTQYRNTLATTLHEVHNAGEDTSELFDHFLEVLGNIQWLEEKLHPLMQAKIAHERLMNWRDDSGVIVA